jgi:hypothetical protein
MRIQAHATLLVWLVVACMNAYAQQDLTRLKDLPFIGYGANRIELRGDSSDWKGLHAKLDRLQFQGEGRINILHVGGSHVQADMWSMQMRHRAQTMAPGLRAARGFIFPYAMAKSNNPYWYEPVFTGTWTAVRNVNRADSSSLGLSGISVTTRDSMADLRISFRGEVYPGYTFNRVTVLHRMDSSMTVQAWTRDSTVRITRSTDTAAWTSTFTYDRHMDTLHLRFTRSDSAHALFTLHGIVLDTPAVSMGRARPVGCVVSASRRTYGSSRPTLRSCPSASTTPMIRTSTQGATKPTTRS